MVALRTRISKLCEKVIISRKDTITDYRRDVRSFWLNHAEWLGWTKKEVESVAKLGPTDDDENNKLICIYQSDLSNFIFQSIRLKFINHESLIKSDYDR